MPWIVQSDGPFTNLDSEGFSLGLTVVKELTEALGGMIFIESKLGEDSVFSVKYLVEPRF